MPLPQIKEILTERALSPTQIDLADYTLNPYRGCGVGCVYCYARSNRNIRKTEGEWGDVVRVKTNFVEKLEGEISGQAGIGRVLIGSTTEPFQEAEKTYHLTGDSVGLLRSRKIPVVILTKSPGVAGLAGLLDYSDRNRVYLTINSDRVRDLFERNSAPAGERLEAARTLMKAGVGTVLYVSPVFPFLTDMKGIWNSLKTAFQDEERFPEIRAEAYNPKMGNWDDVRKLLPDELKMPYDLIYGNPEEYERYWNGFRKETESFFMAEGLHVTVKVEPYDSWYRPGSPHR